MESKDVVYDRVMHMVGEEGTFQKRFNIVFNVGYTFFFTMSYINVILIMAVPNHWCHVPGREKANYTLEEWKNLHLPMQMNPDGTEGHAKCLMYNDSEIANNSNSTRPQHGRVQISCSYGYEYDNKWYSQTAPSAQDWVCDKELHTTNLLVVTRIAEIVGSFIFGQIGDRFGRRLVYIIGLAIMVVGRLVSIFTVSNYPMFVFCCAVALFPSMTPTQSTQVISMEISQPDARSKITLYQNVGWAFGMSVVPMIYWIVKDWVILTLITTLPLLIFIAIYGYLIESPRWLASKGDTDACLKELKKIAKINGTFIPDDTKTLLNVGTVDPEKSYGILSIFSSWSLAKNTILLLLGWASCATSYNIMLMNTSYMKGNPFVNMSVQSAVEMPGYLLGMVVCERAGRRWTGMTASIVGAFVMVSSMFFTSGVAPWVNIVLVSVNKFCLTLVFFVTALQTMEIYPTCLRQTGISLGTVVCSVGAVVAPYIIYWGTNVDVRIPYVVLTLCACICIIVEFLLPETLHVKLPESLQEAKIFGHEQKYWSIPKKDEEDLIKEKIKYTNKRLHLDKNLINK